MITIYDTLAQDFTGPVQLMRHDAQAIRMFTDVMQSANFANHAEDFHLISLGICDETTGQIANVDKRTLLTGAALRSMLIQQAAQQQENNK